MSIPENTSKNTHNVVMRLLEENLSVKRTDTPAAPEDNAEKLCSPLCGARILDIPCGAGAFTDRLLRAKAEVHSADIENILQIQAGNFSQADMNDTLPYDDEFFDAIVCIDGIEHLEKPTDFIRETVRTLSPGGTLILSTPNISSLRSRSRFLFTGHHNKCKTPLDESNPGPLHHISMFTFPEIRYMLHTNSIKIDKIVTNRIKVASFPYMLLVPFAWLATKASYSKNEKDRGCRKTNREIFRQLFSGPVLLGETLIVSARKA
ncbi:MAG: methyltransferase domain-containing protein [Bacteroidales bacterium]|nr:methyltransferase domain-containing protein [Candidatus Latescibacterota bacterium]